MSLFLLIFERIFLSGVEGHDLCELFLLFVIRFVARFEIVAGCRLDLSAVVSDGDQLVVDDAAPRIGGYVDEFVLGERTRSKTGLLSLDRGDLLATNRETIGQIVLDEFTKIKRPTPPIKRRSDSLILELT